MTWGRGRPVGSEQDKGETKRFFKPHVYVGVVRISPGPPRCVQHARLRATLPVASCLLVPSPAMPSSIADPLYERLLSAYPADRSYVPPDWSSGPMPPPIRHFLEQLLHHQLQHERRRLMRARSGWVDYESAPMRRALSGLYDAMEDHPRVPPDEWTGALQQAARYVTAYLLRPAPVLTDFVFGECTEPLPMERVRWRMQFFDTYTYLFNAVEAYAQKKGLDTFERDRFERFLRKIDAHLTADYGADRWLRLLSPLLNLTEVATGKDAVPIRLLKTFFEDKEREDIVDRLQTLDRQGHTRVGEAGLRRLLTPEEETVDTPRETTERAPEVEPLRGQVSESPDAESPDAGAPADWAPDEGGSWDLGAPGRSEAGDAEENADDGATPLWKRFQSVPNRTRRGDGEASPGEPSGRQSGGEPLWAQYRAARNAGSNTTPRGHDVARAGSETGEADRPTTESPAPSPTESSSTEPSSTESSSTGRSPDGGASLEERSSAPAGSPSGSSSIEDLERAVLGESNPPQRGVFIRQLFDGGREDYERVLAKLHQAESWSQASQIIARDIFRAHKVNIYSDAAVHFTNAVEDRFRG